MDKAIIEECFDTKSKYFTKMMKIINTSDPEKSPVHKHHIVPRSYFRKKGLPVYSGKDNLAWITPYEHCMVHYYAWKCATPLMKRSMAAAFHFMVNTACKDLKNIHNIALEYQRATKSLIVNTVQNTNEKLFKYGSSFECYKRDKNILFLRCKICGYEKSICSSFYKKEVECPKCDRKYRGKYPLVIAILKDKHAYYLSGELLPENKQGAYNWSKLQTFAARKMSVLEKTGICLKWSLVGATDIKYELPDLYIPSLTKEQLEIFLYLYEISPRFAVENFNICLESVRKQAEYYKVQLPTNFGKNKYKSQIHRYWIFELDDIYPHTLKEWEDMLGYCWPTICSKYTVQKESSSYEMLKQLCNMDSATLQRFFKVLLKII